MIPDKIYLPKEEEVEDRMPWIATPYEDDPNWDECYIRKDTLLEWANEQIKVAKANNLAYSPFEKLIDKLNEM